MFLCPRTAVFPVRLGPLLLVPQERVSDLRWGEEGGEGRGRREGGEKRGEGGGEEGEGEEKRKGKKKQKEGEDKLTENRVALFLHR